MGRAKTLARRSCCGYFAAPIIAAAEWPKDEMVIDPAPDKFRVNQGCTFVSTSEAVPPPLMDWKR